MSNIHSIRQRKSLLCVPAVRLLFFFFSSNHLRFVSLRDREYGIFNLQIDDNTCLIS